LDIKGDFVEVFGIFIAYSLDITRSGILNGSLRGISMKKLMTVSLLVGLLAPMAQALACDVEKANEAGRNQIKNVAAKGDAEAAKKAVGSVEEKK
jgi:hypothetical protein